MPRLHIFGASGSGTTTLAAALAERLECPHFDADSFFWLPTDPPFEQIRPRPLRQKMLLEALRPHASWVLSGCTSGWGDPISPMIDLAVFLWIPQGIRMERLQKREIARYGADAACPGGVWRRSSAGFLEWAAAYDDGGLDLRSRALHESIMAQLSCPVLRLEGDLTVEDRLSRVLAELAR